MVKRENKRAALMYLEQAVKESRVPLDYLMTMDDFETVEIHYENGTMKTVRTACDSVCAMIRDVMKGIDL